MRNKFTLSFFLFFSVGFVFAQPAERRITRKEYIETYKEDAIREMQKSGVPASITLAQGILESGDGNSPLAVYAKNHFGVKCHSGWKGKSMRIDDDKKNECFRKYASVYDSYKDHSEFLVSRSRYDFLFDLKITDYKGWAKGLKKAGYATNPKYADLLIGIIEKNNLNQYDRYEKIASKKPSKKRMPKVLAGRKRVVKLHNNVKYIKVQKGDTYYRIAKDFEMNLWQIFRYNDLDKNADLKAGDIIYLQPKRNKSKQKIHVVKKGDTLRGISQLYGVKLRRLHKNNQISIGEELNVGENIYLRKRKI